MATTQATEPAAFNPLAVNIIKFQSYTNFFDICESIMFEWFIVKARAFKYNEFYYSNKDISEEVRIGDDRLKTIIKYFLELGIINVEKKGLPRVSHYTVNFKQINTLLPQIFQFSENSELDPKKRQLMPGKSQVLSYFNQLLAESSQYKEYKKGYNNDFINDIKENEKRKEENFAENKFSTESFFSIYDTIRKIINGQTSDLKINPEYIPLLEEVYFNTYLINSEKKIQLYPEHLDKIKAYLDTLKVKEEIEKEKAAAQKEKKRKAAEAEAKRVEINANIVKRLINSTYADRLAKHNRDVNSKEIKGKIKYNKTLPFGKKHNPVLAELGSLYSKESIENSTIAFSDHLLRGEIDHIVRIPEYFLSKKGEDFDVFMRYLDLFIMDYSSDPD